MEWDKIKQKWNEMAVRVQSPQLPGDKDARRTKNTLKETRHLADAAADGAGVLPIGGPDERSSM